MTIEQALKSLSQYPVPSEFIETLLMRIGLSGQDILTQEMSQNRSYKQAMAEVYLYLSTAPSVSENGFSISLDSLAKASYKQMYEQLCNELSVCSSLKPEYGYKGEEL